MVSAALSLVPIINLIINGIALCVSLGSREGVMSAWESKTKFKELLQGRKIGRGKTLAGQMI